MFQNRLTGNIPDDTYVLMYSVFEDDKKRSDKYEAFYCMSKFEREKSHSDLSDVYVQTFYGSGFDMSTLLSSPQRQENYNWVREREAADNSWYPVSRWRIDELSSPENAYATTYNSTRSAGSQNCRG